MFNTRLRTLLAGGLLSLGLVACGGEVATPTGNGTTLAVSQPNNTIAQDKVSPANLTGPTPAALPTGAAKPTGVPANPTNPSNGGNNIPPTATPDLNAFNGKDGLCATLVALPLASMKTAQANFNLSQALAAQQPVMRDYKADARPFAASLSCNGGVLGWTINWTSNAQKQSWVFSSFAKDSRADLDLRVKNGLATYAELKAAALPVLPVNGLAGLDKLAQTLATRGYKDDANILSVTLNASPAPARYIVFIDQGKTKPPDTLILDSVSGSILP